MKSISLRTAAFALSCLFANSLGAASFVDVVVVVDESGSMSTEHAWLPGMVTSLNTRLEALGYTAKFGLYGFGRSGFVGGREFLDAGTAAQFVTAAAGLETTGSTEDGYTGIQFASDNYTFTPGSARNYILVTDEDRDAFNAANTFSSIESLLAGQNALLNAVLNNPFTCTGGGTGSVIGRTTGSGYRANGSGGYAVCSSPGTGNGDGNTEIDYVPLALGSGGAAWNLNLLRAGGNDSVSFTSAFVDIKVQEITTQTTVPEPEAFMLVGSAIVGLLLKRRLRK